MGYYTNDQLGAIQTTLTEISDTLYSLIAYLGLMDGNPSPLGRQLNLPLRRAIIAVDVAQQAVNDQWLSNLRAA